MSADFIVEEADLKPRRRRLSPIASIKPKIRKGPARSMSAIAGPTDFEYTLYHAEKCGVKRGGVVDTIVDSPYHHASIESYNEGLYISRRRRVNKKRVRVMPPAGYGNVWG